MTRKKIQIKKIDNISSRQVTFSKRRKGLFKKAQELSTLCDADVALMVFSATNKLFEYASSSMQQVIERRNGCSENHRLMDHPSADQFQVESESSNTLRKKLEDKSRELRQMNGEDLQELTVQELQKLETLLRRSLSSVSKKKDEMFMQGINTLKRKKVELIQENQRLKNVIRDLIIRQRQQSLESVISSSSYFLEDDGSDTSLKLGLTLHN
ncbi:unnamed protein product [Lathyrus oleraceus]|uniref:Uncharacterized protein n=1 Tax=Pisum sativum TaxID=3888 RepID=A0A9D4ZXG3_PEA|nr:MADS-box protein JOINTLESS-like isoform X2 [Pisum sativum]KAI5386078.1 hypothetical protein KIW84_072593 [Pisum sativum]